MKHYYQPTNFSCGQTAAAMLLSYYGVDKTPDDILREVPVRSWPGNDDPAGTPSQDIATYFCGLGFATEIISFDVWVTDMGWQGKDTEYIRSRLELASGELTAPMIGREGTELYIQAYLDYLGNGGKLSVRPAPTRGLIDSLLAEGPILATVAFSTLYGTGKTITGPGTRESKVDDIMGHASNHTIVISRKVDEGYEVYDPWHKPGIHLVEPDRLIACIATAQQECDNMFIIIRTKHV